MPIDCNSPNCSQLRPIETYWAIVKRILKEDGKAGQNPISFHFWPSEPRHNFDLLWTSQKDYATSSSYFDQHLKKVPLGPKQFAPWTPGLSNIDLLDPLKLLTSRLLKMLFHLRYPHHSASSTLSSVIHIIDAMLIMTLNDT